MNIEQYRFNQKKAILNLILIWSLVLTSFALLINISTFFLSLTKHDNSYGRGIGILVVFLCFALFSNLLLMVRKGKLTLPSFVVVSFFFLVGVYMSYRWGIDLPQGLLIYALVIVITGVVINARSAYLLTFIIVAVGFYFTYLNDVGIIIPNTYWKETPADYRDTLIYAVTFSIIALVSWLSNREIEKSLAKAEGSEIALRKERDNLEIRVHERTQELQKLQMEKMLQIYRFADLGKLAAGLIHDIVNPLTVVSINLEHMYSKSEQSKSEEIQSLKQIMKRAIDSTSRIENYVEATRKQIQQQDVKTSFNLCKELQDISKVFAYRCRKERVKMTIDCENTLNLYGNQVKFAQAISNIIANALDAHAATKKGEQKEISVLVEAGKNIIITISDNASGISKNKLSHIFKPFFTTKPTDKGTGIGLSMTKEIIEEGFSGTIHVQSKKTVGTVFVISLPHSAL